MNARWPGGFYSDQRVDHTCGAQDVTFFACDLRKSLSCWEVQATIVAARCRLYYPSVTACKCA